MNNVALIVTYNRLDKLKKSWLATSLQLFDNIIIVDNASVDGTQEWLSSISDPRLHVLTLEKNIGGAGGFYKGSEYISQYMNADWVFFFDDDAYPDLQLLQTFQNIADVKYSAYACKVCDTYGNFCKMNLPYLTIPNSLSESIRYIMHPEEFTPHKNTSTEIATLSFVGAIVNGKVLKKYYKYIYSDLFIYYDDLYFSHHIKNDNHVMLYEPKLSFVHDIAAPTKKIQPIWKVYYLSRNLILSRYLFKEKRPFSFLSIILRLLKMISLTSKQDKKTKYLKYLFLGVYDGIFKKMGGGID